MTMHLEGTMESIVGRPKKFPVAHIEQPGTDYQSKRGLLSKRRESSGRSGGGAG